MAIVDDAHRRRSGRLARPAAARSTRARLLGRDRPEGERPVRLAAPVPSVPPPVPRSPTAAPPAPPRPPRAPRARRLALLLQPGGDHDLGPAHLSGAGLCVRAHALDGVPPTRRRRAARAPGADQVARRRGDRPRVRPHRAERRRLARDRHRRRRRVGADHITHGQDLYNGGFAPGVGIRGDVYGPVQLPRLRAVRGRSFRGTATGATCRPRTRRRSPSTC